MTSYPAYPSLPKAHVSTVRLTLYFGLTVISLEYQRYRLYRNGILSAAAKLDGKCIRRFPADATVSISGPGQTAGGLDYAQGR